MSDYEGETKAPRKRNRKPVTCAQCRKRKLKCDRLSPCGACKEKGEECIWDGAVRLPTTTYTRDQEALELRSQLDRLEGIIGMLHANSEGQDDFNDYRSAEAGPSGSRRENDVERTSAAEALGLLSSTAGSTLLKQPFILAQDTSETASMKIDDVLNLLPSKSELDILVNQFLQEDRSEFPILNRSAFQERYRNFSYTNARNDPFLVALLFSIAGWSSFWSTTDPQNATMSKGVDNISKYFDASLQLLHLARFMENPSLDTVRALFLMHHYHLVHNSPASKYLLTSAIEVAQSLGLNRDPATYCSSILEIEKRRRIWTLLICADWITSLGQTYVCSPIHYNTNLPANVNEEDISERGLIPQPLTVVTPVLSLLFKASIATSARHITDTCYGFVPPSWINIQDLHSDLARIDSNLPPCLAFEWGNGAVRQFPSSITTVDMVRVHVHLSLRQQFIRLHRPFLTRGFADNRFSFSREKCCWASRYILAIHRGLGTDFRATREWAITYHTLNALIILVVDLLQDPEGNFAEMHLLDVRSSLNILDTLIAPSALVTETSRVLKYLLGRVTSKGEPSKKRKLNPVKDAIAPIPVQGSHQAKNSLDNSDLAYLLSTTQNPSSAFKTHGSAELHNTPQNLHQRHFDPTLPFSRPLPLPTSIDPIPRHISLSDSTFSLADIEYAQIWKGMRKFSSMYAVPDFVEWEEMSKVGNTAIWNEGIDLLK